MGGSKKETTSQNNTVDPWTRSNYNTAAGNARAAVSTPYTPYEGNRVAGLSQGEVDAEAGFRANMGEGMGLLQNAAQQAQAAGGYRPEQVTAQNYNEADINSYMNPYTQNVIDSAMQGIDRRRQGQLGEMNAGAAKASAFGGSRHGVAEAETNRAYGDIAASTEAGLRQDAFTNAQGMWNNDANRQLSVAATNQQAGLQGNAQALQGAGLLSNIGQGMGEANSRDAFALAQFGRNARDVDQRELDAAYQEHLRQYEDQYRRAGVELGILGGTPTIVDSAGTSRQSGSPGLLGIAGGLAQIGSTVGLFSDRRLKTDIVEVASDDGRKWYNYRYLWDKPSVKRLGLMAQDLLKTEPSRVFFTPSGLMKVNYEGLV